MKYLVGIGRVAFSRSNALLLLSHETCSVGRWSKNEWSVSSLLQRTLFFATQRCRIREKPLLNFFHWNRHSSRTNNYPLFDSIKCSELYELCMDELVLSKNIGNILQVIRDRKLKLRIGVGNCSHYGNGNSRYCEIRGWQLLWRCGIAIIIDIGNCNYVAWARNA